MILSKVRADRFTGPCQEVTSDKKMTCNSYQRCKGKNRDYSSYFSVIFETTIKFLIVFVRLILEKVWVDEFIGPRQKRDVRYEFHFKPLL